MDSKQLNQLNPKLKEVYERVMGTSPYKPSSTSPINKIPTSPLPTTKASEPQSPTNIPKPLFPSATPVTQPPTQQPMPKPFQPQPITNREQQNPQPQIPQTTKKQNKMTPIFIVIGIFIFIILYALVWIKVLKLEVPFLPF